jgi:DNA polymerase-4
MGIATLAALREREEMELASAFGPRTGPWLRRRAAFLDDTPLSSEREIKSQSTEITFDTDVSDPEELAGSLKTLSEELCRRLAGRGLEGRSIGIKIRLDDWTNASRSLTLDQPTADPEVVSAAALDLLRAYAPPRPVRLLGVRMAGFGEAATVPADGSAEEAEPQMRLGLAP